MTKDFVSNEKHVAAMFLRDGSFCFNGRNYNVIFADKPTCAKGEPKTDIFVRAKDEETNEIFDLKITYKQSNADFIENKMNAERAAQLFGEEWKEKIISATTKMSDVFGELPLIYCSQKGKTDKGAFTMGWKVELLRVKSGNLSGEIELSREEKIDVYAGNNLPLEKKNAYINGEIIPNSGVADYIFEEVFDAESAQDVVDNMRSIEEYLDQNPNIYYACKALNYRSFADKYDGDRPLSVFVDWNVVNGQLAATIRYDAPLITKGRVVYEKLRLALDELNISTTDDISDSDVENPKIIYR